MSIRYVSTFAALSAVFLSVAALLGPLAVSFRASTISRDAPRAIAGELDLSSWDFDRLGPVTLNGTWEYYPGGIVSPEALEHAMLQGRAPDTIDIPTVIAGDEITAGTLRLRILLPARETDRLPPLLAVKTRYFASANTILIDREEHFRSGVVSTDPGAYQAQYLPGEFVFQPGSDVVEVVVHFANFHHRRIRLNEILLGTPHQIGRSTTMALLQEGVLLGTLILAAIYFGTLYLIYRRGSAYLYLSLIALVSIGRLTVVNERILIRLAPQFPPELMMKIGFAGALLVVPLIVLYARETLNARLHRSVEATARYAVAGLLGLILLTPLRVYDAVFEYGLVFLVTAAVILLFFLARKREPGIRDASLMVAGGIILAATGLSDILRELSIIHVPELFSFGMVCFLVIQGILLARRFRRTFEAVQTLSEEKAQMLQEIQKLNQDLEERIHERTQKLEEVNAQLNELSRTDTLTGLSNRRAFDEGFQLAASVTRREMQPLALLMIDLDAFKAYNDNYGHLAGDECLRRVGTVLQSVSNRQSDLAARYGGEEFVVLLPFTDGAGACTIAEKVRSGVEALCIPHEYSPAASVVTASVGVAASPDGTMATEELLEEADRALYRAKIGGRNRVARCKGCSKNEGVLS